MVAAGTGEARPAGEPLPDRAGQLASGVHLAACGDRRYRDQQQEGDERRQAGLLDARRASLCPPPAAHGADARARERARGAHNGTGPCRFWLSAFM